MSKPDWCPQRVWDEASAEALKYVEWIDPAPVDGVASAEHVLAVSFARAILAAEQRERDACAAIAAEAAEMRARLFDENGASINASKAVQAEEIATAIRNRGSDNDH